MFNFCKYFVISIYIFKTVSERNKYPELLEMLTTPPSHAWDWFTWNFFSFFFNTSKISIRVCRSKQCVMYKAITCQNKHFSALLLNPLRTYFPLKLKLSFGECVGKESMLKQNILFYHVIKMIKLVQLLQILYYKYLYFWNCFRTKQVSRTTGNVNNSSFTCLGLIYVEFFFFFF